jgi:hypothetical protein
MNKDQSTTNLSLINADAIGKMGEKLIDRISEAIGGIARPMQIIRVAKAEAEAKKIHAEADLEISEIGRRAMGRLILEETKKQNNIESIITKSLPLLLPTANPDAISKDWLMFFFEKNRTISDDDMQDIWSKILASEANKVGSYSRRTVEILSSLEKRDIRLFEAFCSFCINFNGMQPIIFKTDDDIYKKNSITFRSLNHLHDLGLVSIEALAGYVLRNQPKTINFKYFTKIISIEFDAETNNELKIGIAMLTRFGRELSRLADVSPVPNFEQYLKEIWEKNKLKVSF